MRILFVIPYYIPAYSYGGPVKVAHDLAKEFVKKGHSATVVTTDVYDARSRNHVKKEQIDGVRIVRFRNFSNYLAKNFNAYLPFGFRKWIKKNFKNYDIVHCHDFFTYQNILVSKYCNKYNIPFVVQPHGCLDSIRMKAKSSRLKALFLKLFKSVLVNAKAIIALTKHEKESIDFFCHSYVRENLQFKVNPSNLINSSSNQTNTIKTNTPLPPQGGLKIQIIPNGINTSEFQDIQKIDLHKKYNLSPDTKLLFYFGRVQHIKGIDYVIKTIAKIPLLTKEGVGEVNSNYSKTPNPLVKGARTNNYQLFIIGPDEGGEKARLEKLIQEHRIEDCVTFVGQIEGEEKNKFLASCDLFLFFSRGEGLPMTILEVAALGIPSMISKECYVPEIAEAGGGYEVNKEDFTENTTLITKHFENEIQIEEMKQNAKKVVKEKFELGVVVEKMLELYCSKT